MLADTIYAHSSGSPPAAIAVIRISGPRAHDAGRLLCGTLPAARTAGVRTLRSSDGSMLDEALVLRFDGPSSATGEDLVELHCHGGRAVVRSVQEALGSIGGLRPARPGEFTRRAFENGRIDLTEAEGLADLLEAETERQRKSALSAAGGSLRREVEGWRDRIVDLAARAEAAIDYVGEDETDLGEETLVAEAAELADELREWLSRPRAEALREGLRVVVAGPPNAGKSSLVNALAQDDRAIVTDIAGTTRDVIEVPLALEGVPFLLVDTAGIRESGDEVERLGISRAEGEVAKADILLWLGDPEDSPDHPMRLNIHAQADRWERRAVPEGSIAASAKARAGLDELRARLIAQALSLLPAEGRVALNARQAEGLAEAEQALREAASCDILLVAEGLRGARVALDRVVGRASVEDVLDRLFGRFCLGK